jgi:hypothetical protein
MVAATLCLVHVVFRGVLMRRQALWRYFPAYAENELTRAGT